MAKLSRKTNRRESTAIRDAHVKSINEALKAEKGEDYHYISKGHIYELIKEKCGLSTRTIQFILNHT